MSPIDWVETRRLALVACYKRGLPNQDAEDIAQTVCLNIWRNHYENASPQLIFTAVEHCHINVWRKLHRERDFADYDQPPDVSREFPLVDDLIDVQTAMKTLTPGMRQAMHTAVLGVRTLTGGEKVQICKARARLREATAT